MSGFTNHPHWKRWKVDEGVGTESRRRNADGIGSKRELELANAHEI